MLVGLVLLSPSEPKANYVGTFREGIGLEIEYLSTDEQGDYQSIYNYMTSKYTKIPEEDARVITQSLIESGKQHQIDPKFTAALIARESGFNKQAISSSGAKGLGQIKDMNFPSLKIQNPYDIRENVSGTTQYIKTLLGYWKNQTAKVSLCLASYLKGPNAVKSDQGILDDKTSAYVHDILEVYEKICVLKEGKPRLD
jgi:soluble lytic murein transglycosylase-like protein